MSMGGAFAARAALESAETWRALVLVNSYDSLEQVLREEFGKWLGPLAAPVVGAVERLAEWRGGVEPRASRPLEWARRIVIPAQVVHGGADQLVPPARGRALFEALASAEKHWLVVDNGDHHRVLTTPQPVYAEMAGWFLRWLK
jgi:pimeloyl-ACP methyl ester carboxylesterase